MISISCNFLKNFLRYFVSKFHLYHAKYYFLSKRNEKRDEILILNITRLKKNIMMSRQLKIISYQVSYKILSQLKQIQQNND